MSRIVKYTNIRNLLAVGLVGVVAFGAMNISNAQDALPAPKNVAAAPADASKTKSGLASLVLKKGTGKEKPVAADTVTVHYTGWDKSGKMFDSSITRGRPAEFPLNQVIKGWTEGLQLMVAGEKRRFWIPAEIAYGDNPAGGRPGGMLCFDVELLSIKKAPVAPKVPADLLTPPKDAEKTATGLVSKVLTKGTGEIKPTANDTVEVHYSGWDKTGKMFDSSVMRGQPAQFPLGQVIKGWTEGLQLMVAGEKRRFWIPAALAYGEVPQRQGAPAGDLCFDVELLKVMVAPKAPANLAKIPENAEVSDGGVKSIVITKGTGDKPTAKSVVMVKYTGWDNAGVVIDTTEVPAGDPIPLPLEKIPGPFSTVLQKMQVGEIRQIWFPAVVILGPNPDPRAPKGPFCYKFELVKINPAPAGLVPAPAPKAPESKAPASKPAAK